MAAPLRILALLSDPLIGPTGQPVERLSLDKEIERVSQQLASINREAELRLLIATPDNLLNTLRDNGPADIIHFSGHGNDGILAFEDGRAGTLPLDPIRWQALFTPLGQPPCQVAFLSACHSESMAEALLAAGVPHVVAIDAASAVYDIAARAFAGQFYPALLSERSVRQAFEFGQAAVLADPATLKACRVEAERNPNLAALAGLLAGSDVAPADALNRFEMLKFKLLPEPADDQPDPHLNVPFPEVPSGQLTTINLPDYPKELGKSLVSFTGRAEELHSLINYVQEQSITTIVGFGGMGKTELALEVGRWFVRRGFFPGGVRFIALGDRHRALDARATIASEFGLNPALAEDDYSLARVLPPNSLLILDELDHLTAEDRRATRSLFEALRDHAPASILATSRQETGIQGEQRFSLRRLAPPAARRLFRTLAHNEVGDELRGGEAELNRILKFLDGYPRAIVQAAPQLKFDPDLAALLADLEESREELLQDPDLPADELRDHESVLVTLNSSYRRLQERDAEAAAFFPHLALFPAGLSSEGINAIFGRPARRRLRAIVDLSLVEIAAPLDYYYLPTPVRSFAHRLLLDDALNRIGPAALRHYAAQTAGYSKLMTEGQLELGVALIHHELPNLYDWLDWGFAGEQPANDGRCITARIMSSLSNFYTMALFRRSEAVERYQAAYKAAIRLKDLYGQANTQKGLGDLAMRVDDLQSAAQRYEAALDLFTQIDAKLGQANTLLSQADLLDAEGDLEQALRNFEMAIAIYQSFNDGYSLAVAFGSLGELWLRNDQAETAYRHGRSESF